MSDDQFATLRLQMLREIALHMIFVSEEIGRARLSDRVMAAMGKVPRHEFVPAPIRPYAYYDGPLPIGYDKTISQPFMAALMTDVLDIDVADTVLEVGTGLGYHAAVLTQLCARVFSVEIVEELAAQAESNLRRGNYDNVEIRIGDGSRGWPEHAPFDKIIVAAGVELIPPMLLQQLKPGGKMVIPVGLEDSQRLMVAEKDANGRLSTIELLAVRFALLETYG